MTQCIYMWNEPEIYMATGGYVLCLKSELLLIFLTEYGMALGTYIWN